MKEYVVCQLGNCDGSMPNTIGIVPKEAVHNGIGNANDCLWGCSGDKFDENGQGILKALQKYFENKA